MHPVFTQAIYYGIVMGLTLFVISVVQKGFFLRYLKVRFSFGRLIMVKVRSVHRDYYRIGWIEEGFLKFKDKKETQNYICRVKIKDRGVFYRALNVLWVDFDELTKSLVKVDFTAISGYDPVSFDELLCRALKRPQTNDKIIYLILVASIVSAIAGVLAFYLLFMQGEEITILKTSLETVSHLVKNIPKPANI